MKKYIFLLFFFFSLGLYASPRIIFENKEFDFEKILEGDTAMCMFHFRNVGDTILHIRDIRATCGCTIVESMKRTYKPNEKGTIRAVFHSVGRRGKINKYIYVLTNDKKNKTVRLRITGTVTRTWVSEPEKVDFGEIEPNGILTKNLFITSTLVDSIKVDSVKTEPYELSAKIISSKGNKVKLKVSYDSSSLKWRFIGIVRFYSNIPNGHKIIIPVYARIKEEKKKDR